MASRAMVIGASGLVGGALASALQNRAWVVSGTAMGRPADGWPVLDVCEEEAVARLVSAVGPEVVFLAAALTDVDGCEQDPERARRVNVDGARHVAQAAADAGALLVFYSSDYVFDGSAGPYREGDEARPISVYGRTKLEAERIIQTLVPQHLILRTTVVFGWDRDSKNFAMQVWQRLGAGERIRLASDQVGNPTLVQYLAEVSLRLVEVGARGIVNVVGRDRIARDEFGRRLAKTFGLEPTLIESVPSSVLSQVAARPLQGGLVTERLRSLLGTEPMALDEALKRVRRQWRAETYVAAGPPKAPSPAETLKREILAKVRQYHQVAHGRSEFTPFRSRVNYSGRVYGESEMVNLVDASLDFWLTLGPWGDRFETTLKRRLGARDVVLVNSGSSANLAAVTALLSLQLEEPLHAGDEVITPAATFPTTIAPLLQNGLVPVLVDCEVGTYNINPKLIEEAVSPQTRAIMVPHTLGNPCDLAVIRDVAKRHRLVLIEDSCDALGSTFDGQPVGTFGDLATLSFFPAHHITMGEGGAVIVNRPNLSRIVRSVRDWGRDCWCAPGESNTCGKRFGWKLGELPEGYDHKFIYSHVGYNLKPTDLQAAIGVAQLDRLDDFVAKRRRNFEQLYEGLKPHEDRVVLPRWNPRSVPAWFGFPITVRNDGSRRSLVRWLEDANIETRDIFGGNILKQPGYRSARVRVHGELTETDRILRNSFFIGVYPGLTPDMIGFVLERFQAFFQQRESAGRVWAA